VAELADLPAGKQARTINASVVELADTQRSGRCSRKGVEVQILSGAQKLSIINLLN